MLTHELQGNRLPGTLLFYGPDGAGKFLTAVELARVVNCEEDGSAVCACRSCTTIKNLISKNLFIISRANLTNIFHLWCNCGVEERNLPYFLRDIRRLTLSFADETRYQKEIQSLGDALMHPDALVDDPEKIIETALSMLNSSKQRVIGIDRIREVQKYLSLRGEEKAKFVILDGAEYMTEEAANSFLKISEDTPEHAVIVLTALKKEYLKETILSRCRVYRFVSLAENTAAAIRKHIFPMCAEKRPDDTKMRMESYYAKLAASDMHAGLGVIREISDNGDAGIFFDFIIGLLAEQVRSRKDIDIAQLDAILRHLNRASFLKKGVFVHHMNVQLALTDFLLNDIPDIIASQL